jgi:hypothetical protein
MAVKKVSRAKAHICIGARERQDEEEAIEAKECGGHARPPQERAGIAAPALALTQEPADESFGGRSLALDDPDGFHLSIHNPA